VFCVALVAVVWWLVPETKGRSLEEIEKSWGRGNPGRTEGMGSAAILAAVSGILPETLRVHGMAFESGVFPRRGFGKMPNPAARMAALPNDIRLGKGYEEFKGRDAP